MSKKGSQRELSFKNAELEIERPEVQELLFRLRKKWRIPPEGFKKAKDHEAWENSLISMTLNNSGYGSSQYSIFLSDVFQLCESLRYPIHWISFFNNFITKGEIKKSFRLRSGRTPNTPRIKISSDDKKVLLEITPNTKLSDIHFVWKDVEKLQKKLPGYDKTRIKRNPTRNLEIMRQLKKGKKPKQIYEDLPYSENPDDIPSLDSINKASQRIKKIIKGH